MDPDVLIYDYRKQAPFEEVDNENPVGIKTSP
jgi:hypothetical protein